MNKGGLAVRQQRVEMAFAAPSERIVVRLMLRCPQCKQKSLAVGKSSGEMHDCKFCGVRFAMK